MSEISKPHKVVLGATVRATPERLFEYLDDHERLVAHMSRSTWAMAGGRMKFSADAAAGRAIGSRLRISGRALGLELEVLEVVAERNPPLRKAWETIGPPRLLVIGSYRMGFEIERRGADSHLRIFIEYALPETLLGRWLGTWLGPLYARWCVRRMLDGVVAGFNASASTHAAPPSAFAGGNRT
jgi:hypothetical protein